MSSKKPGAQLKIHEVEIGEKVYQRGILTGIEPKTWETIQNTKAFLKAPITTPQGGGFKSLNVTVRTTLGLYANIRPCVSYSPFIQTKNPKMDLVIVRENEEDLYAGIEYRQTPDVMVSAQDYHHDKDRKKSSGMALNMLVSTAEKKSLALQKTIS